MSEDKKLKTYLDFVDDNFSPVGNQRFVTEYHLSVADDTVIGSVVVHGNKMPESNMLKIRIVGFGCTVELFGKVTTVDVSQSEYSEIDFVLHVPEE